MARETDLIVKGTWKASPKYKWIKEGEQLKIRDVFLASSQRLEKFKEERAPETCQEIYNRLFEFIKGVMEAARAENRFSLEEGSKVISEILKDPNMLDSLCTNTLAYQDQSDLLVYHSINVFAYDVKVGLALGYDGRQLLELGLAATLHDIGMTKVPGEIIKKSNPLSDDELNEIKKHPIYGHEIIMNLGKEYTWLAEVVFQEHEREQGQGYPQGIQGDQIHEYAKIIGIADVYEALTHPRPHRRREVFLYDAMEEMKALFSTRILKALLTQLTIYPLGCYVKLNSNVIGKVTAVNPDSPLRPIVEAVYDSQGRRLEPGQVLNLSREPFLHIVECLHQEDLPHSIP